MKKVAIQRTLKQVTNGSEYTGTIKIGQADLEYGLVFAVPIDELDESNLVEGEEAIRKLFQITVKKSEVEIDLPWRFMDFFTSLLFAWLWTFTVIRRQ